MRAKLYPIERTVKSIDSNKKRCEVCKNVNVTDNFISAVAQKTHKINHKFNCGDR